MLAAGGDGRRVAAVGGWKRGEGQGCPGGEGLGVGAASAAEGVPGSSEAERGAQGGSGEKRGKGIPARRLGGLGCRQGLVGEKGALWERPGPAGGWAGVRVEGRSRVEGPRGCENQLGFRGD